MPILDLLTDDTDDELNSSNLMDATLEQVDGSVGEEHVEQLDQNDEITNLLNQFELETAISLSYLVTFTSFRGIHTLNVHVKNTEAKYSIVIPKEFKRTTVKMVFLDTMEKSSQRVAKIPIGTDMLPGTRKRVYNVLKKLPHFKPSSQVASFLTDVAVAEPATQATDLAPESTVDVAPTQAADHEDVEPAADLAEPATQATDVEPAADLAAPVQAVEMADPVDIEPSNVVASVYEEDPYDESLNLNLSESLVELQMDKLELDCSICRCSFEYLMDLIDHKATVHTEPSIESEPVPSTSREPPQEHMSQTQEWIDEAMLSIPASQKSHSKNNPSAYARFIKLRRPVLKKKYPDCSDIMKKLV